MSRNSYSNLLQFSLSGQQTRLQRFANTKEYGVSMFRMVPGHAIALICVGILYISYSEVADNRVRARVVGRKRDQVSCPQQPSVARLGPFLTHLALSYRTQGVDLTKGIDIAAVSFSTMPLQALRRIFQTLERTKMIIPRPCTGPSAPCKWDWRISLAPGGIFMGPMFVWDGISWSFVAAPTLKNGNETACVLLGMGMGREVGLFRNDGGKWESTKTEMGWDGTVVS